MVNKVILIGNVGKTPEFRKLESGISVVKFSLATTERRTNRDTGEVKETTEWHNITAWRATADYIGKYVSVGTRLYVEGKLHTEEWTDKEGKKRYTTTIVAENVLNLTPKVKACAEGEGDVETPATSSYDDDLPFEL